MLKPWGCHTRQGDPVFRELTGHCLLRQPFERLSGHFLPAVGGDTEPVPLLAFEVTPFDRMWHYPGSCGSSHAHDSLLLCHLAFKKVAHPCPSFFKIKQNPTGVGGTAFHVCQVLMFIFNQEV